MVSFAAAQAPEQETVTALERRLPSATGTERVQILNELGLKLVWREPDRVEKLATEALALAEKLGDTRGQALAHKNLATSMRARERSAEGLPHMQRALELFISLGDRKSQANALGNLGILFGGMGKTWPAIEATQRALAVFTELGDTKGMAAATNNLAVRYNDVGELEQALRYGLESLRLEESLGRKLGIANNLNTIGNVYVDLEDYVKARGYFEKALPLFEELGEKESAAKAINNIGVTYRRLGQLDEALSHFQRSLEIGIAIGSREVEASARNSIGIVLTARERYDDSAMQFLKVVELDKAIGNETGLPAAFLNLADVRNHQGRYQEALAYLETAKALCLEAKSKDVLDSIYRATADNQAALGRWKDAYENELKYSETREATLGEARGKKIAELQEKYDAEARQKQIELLAKDNELLKKDGEIRRLALVRSRLLAGLLVAVTALVVGATLVLFRRYLYLLAFWKKRSFVGQYRIEQEITTGGMGVIYRATSLVEPARPVALKVIREELARDEKQRQRFINEGRIIDALDHPGIVKVLDRGEHAGRLYLAMELLEGRTLAALIAEATSDAHPIELRRCLGLLRQLVDAVVTIHAHGVIHRDISPANVIVIETEDGERAKLLDFGLAKADTMTTLTEAGELLGTLSYLAPERIQLRELTPASDVFSLGAVAYELLTLSRPFVAEEPAEMLRQLLMREPIEPVLLRPELGTELSKLVMAMLAKDPLGRPGDEELRHRVERACEVA
jgi:tetratricopeptide (TPR) repeat protein